MEPSALLNLRAQSRKYVLKDEPAPAAATAATIAAASAANLRPKTVRIAGTIRTVASGPAALRKSRFGLAPLSSAGRKPFLVLLQTRANTLKWRCPKGNATLPEAHKGYE